MNMKMNNIEWKQHREQYTHSYLKYGLFSFANTDSYNIKACNMRIYET